MSANGQLKRTATALLLAGLLLASSSVAQQPVTPRERPEPSAEQLEVLRWVNPLITCAPDYPGAAAALKQEGWVRVGFTISTEGVPLDLRVVDSSPAAVFDSPALAAVSKCRFRPRLLDGQPIVVEGAWVDMIFKLANE